MPKLDRRGRLLVMCAGTSIYFLAEIIVGTMAGSVSLVADSFHMLSDLIGMGVAWYAISLAARTSRTEKLSYGWQRAEVLGALVNGVFLLALCFTIFIEALQRFAQPKAVDRPMLVLVVGAIGLAINTVGLGLFHDHAHGHGHGHSHGPVEVAAATTDAPEEPLPGAYSVQYRHVASTLAAQQITAVSAHDHSAGGLNMRGVFLHLAGDALGSLAVIVSALVNKFCQGAWVQYIDPIASILITIILVAGTLPIVRDAALILLQGAPTDVDIGILTNEILKVPGVLAVHEFHVWQLAEGKSVASVHALMDGVGCGACSPDSSGGGDGRPYMQVALDIKTLLHNVGVSVKLEKVTVEDD
ncbi:hypothetical protein HKX48_000866 [Thoreauomyces humboldtii]|nr:hypothetical protein HKX48_000866 [Thoreauomyces humboldtii]